MWVTGLHFHLRTILLGSKWLFECWALNDHCILFGLQSLWSDNAITWQQVRSSVSWKCEHLLETWNVLCDSHPTCVGSLLTSNGSTKIWLSVELNILSFLCAFFSKNVDKRVELLIQLWSLLTAMALILCDADIGGWNHYLVCALVLAVFCVPLGSPQGARGNLSLLFGNTRDSRDRTEISILLMLPRV
jgi:hypothetical protein